MRTLKSRGIRSFAFIAPSGIPAEEAVRAIVEGAHVGNFDADYYRSDRKDQKIDALIIAARATEPALEKAANERRSSASRRTSRATWSMSLPIA